MQLLRIFINLSAAALIFQGGSSAKIEWTNHYYDDLDPDAFTLRCEPDSDGHCDKSVILLEMTNSGGKAIASVSGNDKIKYGSRMQSYAKALGHIESDASKCFLSVTFTNAVKEDSGVYSCSVIYLDSRGKQMEEHGSANVSVEGVELQDVMRQVLQKLALLEHVVSFNKNQTDELISTQGNKINSIEDDVTGLIDQSLQVQQLIDKEQEDETMAAFSAVCKGKGEFNVGDTLVCHDADLNIGNYYNTLTGEFMAPRSGLYVFHLVVSGFGNVEVRVNDVPMSSATSGCRYHPGHQAVAHAVVKLEAGDQVRPVVMERIASRRFFSKRKNKTTQVEYHSMFSGYLLKATLPEFILV